MTRDTDRQLTLDVALDPDLGAPDDAYIAGSLKINGSLVCPRDLNAGDEVTITVADADGTIIGQAQATATYPGFREIKDRGEPIGVERINTVAIR